MLILAVFARLPFAAPVRNPPPVATSEDVRLAWKLKEGDTLRYRIVQEIHDVSAGSGDFATDVGSGQVLQEKVKSVASDGTATIECTWEALRIQMSIPMVGDLSFDSTRTDGPASSSGQLKGLASVVGATFRMHLKRNGEVVSVSGVNEALSKAFPEDDPSLKLPGGILGQSFNDDGMRRTLQSAFLPDKSVAAGAMWKHDATFHPRSLGDLKLHLDFAFTGMEKVGSASCAKLDVKYAMEFGGTPDLSGPPGAEQFDTELKLEEGKGEGTIYFAPSLGRMIQSSTVSVMRLAFLDTPKGAREGHGGKPTKTTVSSNTKQTVALLAAGDPPFALDAKPAAKSAGSPKGEKK